MRVLSIDPGSKNLGLCILERTDSGDTIVFWNVVEVPTEAVKLRNALDSLLEGMSYDHVVIERQPPHAGMNRLQHLFEMYFVMKDKPVSIMDARTKLKYIHAPSKMTYRERKAISVDAVKRYLETSADRHEDALKLFETVAKKDDYSDALLQALAYYTFSM